MIIGVFGANVQSIGAFVIAIFFSLMAYVSFRELFLESEEGK